MLASQIPAVVKKTGEQIQAGDTLVILGVERPVIFVGPYQGMPGRNPDGWRTVIGPDGWTLTIYPETKYWVKVV